jgi:Squalene-hopene cyclase C-terminal domain
MQVRLISPFAMSVICLLSAGSIPARADGPEKQSLKGTTTTPEQAHTAVERGLDFLQTDAADWREERKCASCHHGAMTVWTLCEAKSLGYPVDDDTLKDMTKWTKERLANIDQPRDPRPGFSMVNTPAVFLGMMSLAVPTQTEVSPIELEQIVGHLVQHQEPDGSWAWSLAPAQNRPPPVFESDEIVSLMACLMLDSRASANASEKPPADESRERASAWLQLHEPGKSAQARALQLLREVREGKPKAEIESAIERLMSLQHPDGGWGQETDLPSDAFATGQALYFLSLSGVAKDRPEIQRAVQFLVSNQNDNGSWPMKSRAHPGAKPMTNPVPITYFGSAWSTMGLMRSLEK